MFVYCVHITSTSNFSWAVLALHVFVLVRHPGKVDAEQHFVGTRLDFPVSTCMNILILNYCLKYFDNFCLISLYTVQCKFFGKVTFFHLSKIVFRQLSGENKVADLGKVVKFGLNIYEKSPTYFEIPCIQSFSVRLIDLEERYWKHLGKPKISCLPEESAHLWVFLGGFTGASENEQARDLQGASFQI